METKRIKIWIGKYTASGCQLLPQRRKWDGALRPSPLLEKEITVANKEETMCSV